MKLNEYLSALRSGIERLDTHGFAESIDFHEELRAGKQAIVKAEIVLIDSSLLIIRNKFYKWFAVFLCAFASSREIELVSLKTSFYA